MNRDALVATFLKTKTIQYETPDYYFTLSRDGVLVYSRNINDFDHIDTSVKTLIKIFKLYGVDVNSGY